MVTVLSGGGSGGHIQHVTGDGPLDEALILCLPVVRRHFSMGTERIEVHIDKGVKWDCHLSHITGL
jgi:hypothetical protein